MSTRAMAWIVVFALAAAAAEASAQAVCSAPHSSPTLSRAGIGTLPAGAGWLQATAYHARADAFFGPDGDSRPFLSDGRARTSSIYLTAAAGVLRGVEVWAQVPVHHLVFEDLTGRRTRTGLGDPRISARIGGALFGVEGVPVTVRGAIKFPGSDFPVDPNLLPLSEAQTDVELVVEAGRMLSGSYPLHIVGWAGYRWRFEDADRDRKPGDERFFRLGVGGPIGLDFRWDLAAEGLWGDPLQQQGFRLDGARRRLVQVLPTLGYRVGGAELELTARISVAGRNLPSGPALSAGVLIPWVL